MAERPSTFYFYAVRKTPEQRPTRWQIAAKVMKAGLRAGVGDLRHSGRVDADRRRRAVLTTFRRERLARGAECRDVEIGQPLADRRGPFGTLLRSPHEIEKRPGFNQF